MRFFEAFPDVMAYAVGNKAIGKSKLSVSYEDWNGHLREGLGGFRRKFIDASVLLFSSWDIFTRILDSPETFGFPATDVCKAGGAIWVDQLHPTSAVHAIIAKDVMEFLDGFTVSKTGRDGPQGEN